MNKKIVIDPEFESLLPALRESVYKSLESEIISDGKCRDSLVVWQEEGILVDGHNRYRICEKHGLELPPIVYKSFKSREDAKDWMYTTQYSRRSYTKEQEYYHQGKHYSMEKPSHGGDRKSSSKKYNLKTHERLAKLYGISSSTIINNEKYYNVIESIGAISLSAKEKVLDGNSGIKRKDVTSMYGCSDDELHNFVAVIMGGVKVAPKTEFDNKFKKHKGGWYVDGGSERGYLEILPTKNEGYYHYSYFEPNREQIHSKRGMLWEGVKLYLSFDKNFTLDELIPFDMKPIEKVGTYIYSKGEYPNNETEQSIRELAKKFFVSPETVSMNFSFYHYLSLIQKHSPEAASEIAEEANKSPWGMRELFNRLGELDTEQVIPVLCELIDGERDYGHLVNKFKYLIK